MSEFNPKTYEGDVNMNLSDQKKQIFGLKFADLMRKAPAVFIRVQGSKTKKTKDSFRNFHENLDPDQQLG